MKTFFSKYFFVFVLYLIPGCLKTCVFGVTNYVIPKRASVQLLHGPINLDLHERRKKNIFCNNVLLYTINNLSVVLEIIIS